MRPMSILCSMSPVRPTYFPLSPKLPLGGCPYKVSSKLGGTTINNYTITTHQDTLSSVNERYKQEVSQANRGARFPCP